MGNRGLIVRPGVGERGKTHQLEGEDPEAGAEAPQTNAKGIREALVGSEEGERP